MVFRVGLAGEMLTCVIDVALAMILYVLLKPASRNLALLAALFRVTFVGVYAVAKLFLVAVVILLVIGRMGYLTNSFAQIVASTLAATLFPWSLLPGFVAELGLALRLIVKGIDVPKWEARAQS